MTHNEVVIDGYNLLYKLFPASAETTLDELRGKTETALRRFQLRHKCSITIVYDGSGIRDSCCSSKLHTIYTASSKTADAWIIDYVKSLNTSRKMVTIVSSDREVSLYGKAYGAKSLTSEEFIGLLEKMTLPEFRNDLNYNGKFGNDFLDSSEVMKWKRLFENGK